MSSYNRYEEPSQWPSLSKSRRESKNYQNRDCVEERRSTESYGRIVDVRSDMKSSTPIKVNREYSRRTRKTYTQKESEREIKMKTNEKEKKSNFYESYDLREEEIRKEDWGIALRNMLAENLHKTDTTSQRIYGNDEEPFLRSFTQNKRVPTCLYSDIDQTIEICVKLVKFMQKDNDLRRLFFAMLEGHCRVDSDRSEFEDREEEEFIKKVKRRKREEDTEEEKTRQRQLIKRIKKKYNGNPPTDTPRN